MNSRASAWIWNAVSTILLISTLGCAVDHRARTADPRPPEGPLDASDDEATRGIHVEQPRLCFKPSLWGRRSKTAAPHELHDGDRVLSGDRIRAAVVTSEDAFLYVAFCSGHALTVYPSQHGLRTHAGATEVVPGGDGDLLVDNDPGPEVMYLIVSRTELSLADPQLAGAIARARQGLGVLECDRVLRRKRPPEKCSPPPVDPRSPDPDFIRSPATTVRYEPDGTGSPWGVGATDASGIAVVRYRLTHAASPSR